MRGKNLRFSDFAHRLDYEALYADLGWEPSSTYNDEDKGFCMMPENHKNGDTTGKLAINRNKHVYNCWVCGGGSILSLVMEVKGLDHHEATAYLFQFADAAIKESPDDFYTRVAKLLEHPEVEKKPLPYFNVRVLDPWLCEDHPWFIERHIALAIIRRFRLGYDPRARKYHPKWGEYEGPGIILPHFWKDKLIGWQTRWLDEELPKWVGRYANTTDFPREETIWGYDYACQQARQPIVVESVSTALSLISQGYSAVATFGSQITPDQLKLLRVFNQGLMLARDNDSPGELWFTNAQTYLNRYIPLLEVPVVEGNGADLGDLHPTEIGAHLSRVARM